MSEIIEIEKKVTEKKKEEEKSDKPSSREWTRYEKFSFRIAFIFFFIMTVPLSVNYYKKWLTVDWTNLHIRDINSISHYGVSFITIDPESNAFFTWGSYVNWAIVLGIAIIGAVIWSFFDKKSTQYTKLYYFIKVAVRFTVLIQLTGLTFSKVFPSQMPLLSVSQLSTNYGDFTAQKLYWIQMSIAQNYEVFAGLVELLIMTLLFFRRTSAVGAALALAMIGNITIANHTYDGGVHVLAAFHTLGGLFILWTYWPSIWNLIVNEKNTSAEVYHYPFSKPWEKALRLFLKSAAFGIFFLLSGYLHWHNYTYDSYKVPARPGLTNARGYYEVTEFRINNKVIPYSPVDSVRWQEATFEKWSTFTFKVNRKFKIHGEAGRGKAVLDVDRAYESAGTGGGKRHYYYEADTVKQIMKLVNKNKIYKDETLTLHYSRPSADRFILTGLNEFKDSIYVVLDRKEKTYPVYEGRRKELSVTP